MNTFQAGVVTIFIFFFLILKDIKTYCKKLVSPKSFMGPGLFLARGGEVSPRWATMPDTWPDVLMETPFPSWILPWEITDMLTPHLHTPYK